MAQNFLQKYDAYCHTRRAENHYRMLRPSEILGEGRIRRGERIYLNFAGNDYLGLSLHPALIEGARECAARYGAGSAASRLVAGEHPLYAELEEAIARDKGQKAALVLPSGYQTNLTILAALADSAILGQPVALIADRLAHHSILQAAALARARLMRFRHNDCAHLTETIKKAAAAGYAIIVATESVFGMDGDQADLAAIAAITQKYGALLYVDEAHATGVCGARGFGVTPDFPGLIDISMGTFGKALGGFGSYIACAAQTRDYLIQKCGGLIYTTALPPAVLGAMGAAWALIPALDSDRKQLTESARFVRSALVRQGWRCGSGETHIIPVIVGTESQALGLANQLDQEGFFAPAIRPPTVPKGESRIRLSLSAAHKVEDLERFCALMAALAPEFAQMQP